MILEDILSILKEKSTLKAYTINGQSYTYAELYKFICNIYKFIEDNNETKLPIIVYGDKQVYMKATFLACSLAGVTYVPIDNCMPKERVDYIIKQVKPYCIIGDYESNMCENIAVEKICEIMNNEIYKDVEKIELKANDIYYIIFTSGSTGNPKGVKVTYSNLDSCIKWLQKIIKIENGVILNQAIFSFDLSVADLYLSLISRSEHFILSKTNTFNFEEIFDELQLSNSTMAVLTPSFVDLLLLDKKFNKQLLPKLDTILFCGEKLLGTTVEKLYLRFGDIKIINSYGPTECTFAVTSITLTRNIAKKMDIPLGKPKEDVKIFILDKDNRRLPEGKIGQILITGKSVANGYLEQNNNDSFITYEGEHAYLTGDLGYIKRGLLYYKDRIDNQIKFKGYRIELRDIEENLYKFSYVEKAKVIVKKTDMNIVKKVIAFIKLRDVKTKQEIKSDLEKVLPKYMIPSIEIINEFPINKNGKIDIESLRIIVDGR